MTTLSTLQKSANAEMLVQPKCFHFRYKSDKSSAVIGGHPSNFPQIKISEYKGPAVIFVQAVDCEDNFKSHPNSLLTKCQLVAVEDQLKGSNGSSAQKVEIGKLVGTWKVNRASPNSPVEHVKACIRVSNRRLACINLKTGGTSTFNWDDMTTLTGIDGITGSYDGDKTIAWSDGDVWVQQACTGIAVYYFGDISADDGVLKFDDMVMNRSKKEDIFANIKNKECAYSESMESSIKQVVENGQHRKGYTTRVRLCFQVMAPVMVNGSSVMKEICTAYSDVIEDIMAHPAPEIVDLLGAPSPIQGGTKIMVLCSKIPIPEQRETKNGNNKKLIPEQRDTNNSNNKIEIHISYGFDKQGKELYEKVEPNYVHKQTSLTFISPDLSKVCSITSAYQGNRTSAYQGNRTSPYQGNHFHVKVRLCNPSKQLRSEPWDYVYYTEVNGNCEGPKCDKRGVVSDINSPLGPQGPFEYPTEEPANPVETTPAPVSNETIPILTEDEEEEETDNFSLTLTRRRNEIFGVEFNIHSPGLIYIADVKAGTPAEASNKIHVGDRILAVNEKQVKETDDINSIIAIVKERDTSVNLTLSRQPVDVDNAGIQPQEEDSPCLPVRSPTGSTSSSNEEKSENADELLSWSIVDKGYHISYDGLRIQHTGTKGGEGQASLIRTTKPISSSATSFYFEATVIQPGEDGSIVIGLTKSDYPVNGKVPGWYGGTIGYHGDDGGIYHEDGRQVAEVETFGSGDTVGCYLRRIYINEVRYQQCFFTKNGEKINPVRFLEDCDYYPTMGLASADAVVTANLGEKDFMVEIKAGPGLTWVMGIPGDAASQTAANLVQQQHQQLNGGIPPSQPGTVPTPPANNTANMANGWRPPNPPVHTPGLSEIDLYSIDDLVEEPQNKEHEEPNKKPMKRGREAKNPSTIVIPTKMPTNTMIEPNTSRGLEHATREVPLDVMQMLRDDVIDSLENITLDNELVLPNLDPPFEFEILNYPDF